MEKKKLVLRMGCCVLLKGGEGREKRMSGGGGTSGSGRSDEEDGRALSDIPKPNNRTPNENGCPSESKRVHTSQSRSQLSHTQHFPFPKQQPEHVTSHTPLSTLLQQPRCFDFHSGLIMHLCSFDTPTATRLTTHSRGRHPQ